MRWWAWLLAGAAVGAAGAYLGVAWYLPPGGT